MIKGGAIAWAPIGDANASIPTPQPVLGRPMFAAAPAAAPRVSLSFVSEPALADGLAERLGLRVSWSPSRTRDASASGTCPTTRPCPTIQVDPETFVVRVDGEAVEPRAAGVLPLAQRYSLF